MIQLSANILFRGHCWNFWVWAYLTEPLVQAIAAIGIILGLLSTFGSLWWVSVVLLHPYHKLFSLMRRLHNNLGNATQHNATQHNTTQQKTHRQARKHTHTHTEKTEINVKTCHLQQFLCPTRTNVNFSAGFPSPGATHNHRTTHKQKKQQLPPQKKRNNSAPILGLVSLVIPFLGSMGSCGPFVDAVCDMRCDYNQCTDVEKQAPCLARLEIWRHPEVAWWLSFRERNICRINGSQHVRIIEMIATCQNLVSTASWQ